MQALWTPELRHFKPDTPVVLVGCQSDLRTAGGESKGDLVGPEEAAQCMKAIGAVAYIEW